jgi:hypothetical protein
MQPVVRLGERFRVFQLFFFALGFLRFQPSYVTMRLYKSAVMVLSQLRRSRVH